MEWLRKESVVTLSDVTIIVMTSVFRVLVLQLVLELVSAFGYDF